MASVGVRLGALVVLAGVVTGCSPMTIPAQTSTPTSGDVIQVVASTDVYGDIVATVGGDRVEVVSLITSPVQDPHEFEPSTRDQLTVGEADLIILNGAGYDPFMSALISASSTKAPVLVAAQFSPAWPAGSTPGPDFNEHVWYQPATIGRLIPAIVTQLSALDPDAADEFSANAEALAEDVDTLTTGLADIREAHGGEQIFATTPLPLPMTAVAGLVDSAPAGFSAASESGSDIAPAAVLDARAILSSGAMIAVVANSQTGGTQTEQIIAFAREQSVPVIEFAETLPEGLTYVSWMQANITALSAAVGP